LYISSITKIIFFLSLYNSANRNSCHFWGSSGPWGGPSSSWRKTSNTRGSTGWNNRRSCSRSSNRGANRAETSRYCHGLYSYGINYC